MARLKDFLEGPVPSYTLEDLPVQDYPRAPVAPSYELEDVAQGPTPEAIAKIAKRNVSLTSPIPTASAPVTKDAAAPVTSALPSTGPRTPAGPPDSSGKDGMPAPSSEGAGGDASERDLYLARLAAQSAAGFGSMGAGKSIDMGIADTLGERLKQVQALRAKREERAADVAQEQAQYEGANLATLATNLAAFEGRPEIRAALENLRPGAKFTKPSDFIKSVYQAVTNPPKVEGLVADVKLKGAKKDTEVAKGAEIGPEGVSKRDLRSSQEDLNRARAAALRNKALVDATASNKEAREAKADARAAEAAVTRAMERANDKNDVTNTANNFTALEEVAPGFAKGQKPEWIGRFTLQKAMEVPAISDKAAALNSALENFTANIRKTLFGASLTGNEKASFDLIVNRKLTATPEQLAAAVNTLRRGAARFAQNHFTTSMEFHPQETARVLRSSAVYGPALREGGIYSDVWTLPAAPAPAGQASVSKRKPQPANTTAMRDEGGALKYVPNDQVQAAEAAGWKRE